MTVGRYGFVGATWGASTSTDLALTPHITLHDLTASGNADRLGLANTPTINQTNSLRNLALRTLEPIWAAFGGLDFSSGYRSPEVNATVKGSHESQHMSGEATDFKPRTQTSEAVVRWLWAHPEVPVDQVILYHPSRGGHVHVSLKTSGTNRRQFLYAPAGSTEYVPWTPTGVGTVPTTGEDSTLPAWGYVVVFVGAVALLAPWWSDLLRRR